jgi:hypothetical protein
MLIISVLAFVAIVITALMLSYIEHDAAQYFGKTNPPTHKVIKWKRSHSLYPAAAMALGAALAFIVSAMIF